METTRFDACFERQTLTHRRQTVMENSYA